MTTNRDAIIEALNGRIPANENRIDVHGTADDICEALGIDSRAPVRQPTPTLADTAPGYLLADISSATTAKTCLVRGCARRRGHLGQCRWATDPDPDNPSETGL